MTLRNNGSNWMSVCSLFWIQSTSLINNTFFSMCIQYSADFHILVINGARLFAYVYSTVKKAPQKCVYLTNWISALVWTSVALLVWTRFKLSNGHWHVHNEVRFWTCYILNVQVLHLSFKTIVMFKFSNIFCHLSPLVSSHLYIAEGASSVKCSYLCIS